MAVSSPPFVKCEQLHPGLAVDNIATAVDFYTKKLGFVAAFTWGDPPTFAGGHNTPSGPAKYVLHEARPVG